MTELQDLQKWGAALISQLRLTSSPIGLKLVSSESDFPPNSFRPKRNKGQHLAQCQAFALSRLQGLTVAMAKEDHWCWGPLLGYGLVDHRPALSVPETRHQAAILPIGIRPICWNRMRAFEFNQFCAGPGIGIFQYCTIARNADGP